MTYSFKTVKSIQLEISSYCNAACPQCPRNYYGGETIGDLPLVNWSLEDLKKILSVNFVQQLEFVYFCGTYGDPMYNKNIVAMCKWLKSTNSKLRIGIHTNGSLAKKQHYKDLASLVDFMAFGIDGLEDTNHIYRRNTVWSRIIKNVQAFINEGGTAHWDFIVFEHNQHQIDQASDLSNQLKFKTFNIKKTYRFFNKEHKLVPAVKVFNKNRQSVYEIKPASDIRYINRQYETLKSINVSTYVSNSKIACHSLHKNEIYIGADGYVFPCGWLHDRLYGIESEHSLDRKTIFDMMEEAGGRKMANCLETPLQQIVDGKWFDAIQNSWHSNHLERCAWMCGDKINLIQEQNIMVNYDL